MSAGARFSALARACSCSMVFAPTPRGGVLTTRMKLTASAGLWISRR